MMQVLFSHTPKMARHFTPRLALQVLFVQTWYMVWSLSTLMLFTAPLLSLSINKPISHVSYWQFLLHHVPTAATGALIWFWSRPWQLPAGARLTWRGIVLHVARWVVVLSALAQVVLRVRKPYMITTKGVDPKVPPFPLMVIVPYLALSGASLAACWWYLTAYGSGPVQGHLFFAQQGCLIFWALIAVILVLEIRSLVNVQLSLSQSLRLRLAAVTTLTALTLAMAATAYVSLGRIVQALMA
jgi:hypothetical protein